MANLNNVSQIRHNGSDISLMKFNGTIIYQKQEVGNDIMIISSSSSILPILSSTPELTQDDFTYVNGVWCYKITEPITSIIFDGSFLKEVINLNIDSLTIAENMFDSCQYLTSLDLSNLDTSNVTNMNNMFFRCSSLTSLDLSNFNTSNVTYMSAMFRNCTKLTTLDLSNFDTTNVIDTDLMFYMCNALHTLRLDNCSTNTINDIITSSLFPTSAISGVTRKIYCKKANVSGLIAPTNWVFEYID